MHGEYGASHADKQWDSQPGWSPGAKPDTASAPASIGRPGWMVRLLPGGIRERLFLLIALALLPVLVLQGWIYYQNYTTRRSQALQMELEMAEGVATTFSAYADGVRRQLDTIGQAIIALSPYDETKVERVLKLIAAQYTTVRSMNWVSPEGIVVASSQPTAVGRAQSDRSYFQQILTGRPWVVSDLVAHGVVVDAPGFIIATAVRDQSGLLRGVVAASLDSTRLGQLTLTQARFAGGVYAIFDGQGRLVYQNPETPLAWEERLPARQADPLLQQALGGRLALGVVTSKPQGGRHFAARVPIADTGWVAGAARPVDLVLAPVRQGLREDALFALLATSLAFLLAYLLARTIAAPLRRLEQDARAMGEARVEAPADPVAPKEVRRLRDTVARMASDLIRRAEALRQSEQRFQAVLENSLDAAYRRDLRRDRYEYLSPVVEQIMGFSPEEMSELTTEEVLARVHPEDAQRVRRELFEAEETGLGTVEYRFQCKDGTYRWLADYFVVQKDEAGRPRHYSGSVRNITERKKAEEALHDLTRTLETRVAQRTAELEQRARQLQKLTLELSQTEDRERKRLAAILHDDLQQQLAAAKFHLGLLGKQVRGNASLHEALAEVEGMLKGAIDQSRSLSHELSPALLYHGDFGETLEGLAHQIQAKHGLVVQVEVRGRVEVPSDPVKTFLFRAAQEILFNIVKHAHVAGAAVRLQRRRGRVWLTVRDRGRGFDPKTLGQAAGFGLLSIRERVELLGGRMKIRSAPGRGSAFLITVPDAGPQDEAAGAGDEETEWNEAREASDEERAPASGSARLRVLLADDHEVMRQGLASLLNEQEDIEVVGQAANGQEALDLARQLRPDVVVMDVAMPVMAGDQATRQIKRCLPRLRVIGLSMFEEPALARTMRRAGAERYLLKTVPLDELLVAIRGHTPDS
jgi:PAS domain S-box-containing protein